MLFSQLNLGQEATITSINIKDKKIKRHLLDMGLTCGTKIKIKKIAPTGDPMVIELRGYELCIGKSQLEQIEVEVILKC